jgi:hypothetical protein
MEQCRINRPNTWQLRPAVRKGSENPCQQGAVHTWHEADVAVSLIDVWCYSESGHADAQAKPALILSWIEERIGAVERISDFRRYSDNGHRRRRH